MENNKSTLFLLLGAFLLGIFVFWGYGALTKRDTAVEEKNTDNSTKEEENNNTNGSTNSDDTEITEIANGKALDLSGQGLQKLPEYVLARTDLEELDISNNSLTGALPSEIGKLTKLKVLNASNNSMTGVPAEIGHLPKLEVLDLSNNQLTGLPNELGQLNNLKVLNLSGNNYSEQDLTVIKQGLSGDVTIIVN